MADFAASAGMELFHVGNFRNIWNQDPTLFDGLGPCFGLVQIALRYRPKFAWVRC